MLQIQIFTGCTGIQGKVNQWLEKNKDYIEVKDIKVAPVLSERRIYNDVCIIYVPINKEKIDY